VQRLFFTADGSKLVVASPDEGATYDVHTGKELSRLVGNTTHTVSHRATRRRPVNSSI
jgi:hypothetical protein